MRQLTVRQLGVACILQPEQFRHTRTKDIEIEEANIGSMAQRMILQ